MLSTEDYTAVLIPTMPFRRLRIGQYISQARKLCAVHAPDARGTSTIPTSITIQQLADLLSIHVTTCSRLISTLEADGIIKRTRSEIAVYHLERLSDYEGID